MVLDFCTTIVTENLKEQVRFYRQFLGLDYVFKGLNSVGLGLYDEIYIVLKQAKESSTNQSKVSDAVITLTFQCQEDMAEVFDTAVKKGYEALFIDNKHIQVNDFDGNTVYLSSS